MVDVCVRVGWRGGVDRHSREVGVEGVPSNLATAVRTVVITVFAWTIVLAAAFLGESVGWRLSLGVALMTIGAVLTIGA
jgi:uncharacterized membrane protein